MSLSVFIRNKELRDHKLSNNDYKPPRSHGFRLFQDKSRISKDLSFDISSNKQTCPCFSNKIGKKDKKDY